MTSPAAGKGLDLGSIAEAIKAAIEGHFAAAEVDLPARRLIAPGQAELIAWDSEQLVVTTDGIGLGPAPTQAATAQRAGNPISAAAVRHAIFTVQLVRCVPEATGGGQHPPAPEKVTKAGLAFMRDAGLLSQALVEVCVAVGEAIGGGQVQPGAVTAVGPQGGMAAAQATIAVTAGNLA